MVITASSARDLLIQKLYVMSVSTENNLSSYVMKICTQGEEINLEVKGLKLWPGGERFQSPY